MGRVGSVWTGALAAETVESDVHVTVLFGGMMVASMPLARSGRYSTESVIAIQNDSAAIEVWTHRVTDEQRASSVGVSGVFVSVIRGHLRGINPGGLR